MPCILKKLKLKCLTIKTISAFGGKKGEVCTPACSSIMLWVYIDSDRTGGLHKTDAVIWEGHYTNI